MTRAAEAAATDMALPEVRNAEEAYDFCRKIAHRYGANFSVGFRFLPKPKRDAVYAAYAVCRWADDIADEPGERIEERLTEWEEELVRCYRGNPGHPVTVALADALTRFPVPLEGFTDLIAGCRQDLTKTRYETFQELRGYCDLVATSISNISLPIFGYSDPAALDRGRDLSTALQLTNIARDIGDDLPRDRIYVPQEELARFGISESDLRTGVRSEAMRAFILFQIDRAAGFFHSAEPLLKMITRDSRFPTLLMGGVYAEVLARLREDPFLALGDRIRLSTPAKIGVILSRLWRPRFV